MDIKSVETIKTGKAICEVCGSEIITKSKGVVIYCSTKCRQKGSNEKTRLQNQEKFLKEHGDDPLMPICKECGWKAFDLITHITKFHKTPMKEYYAKHNCTQMDVFHPKQLEERQERVSGDKNPGFEHNGRLSSISKNFKNYVGKTDEEKEAAIKEIQSKQAASREASCGYTTRLDYWTTRGFSREEAIVKVQERQRTFSKAICIAKYGIEKGTEIWLARQELWLDSLYTNLTEQEYSDLTQRKIQSFVNGWSKIATSLFKLLDHEDAIYADESNPQEAHIIMEDGSEFTYPVDYMLGNKVIEFYGDQIHANPRYFKHGDESNGIVTHNVQKIWDRDARKQKIITDNGYDLLVVWEHDYKWNKESTIQKCKDFLGI